MGSEKLDFQVSDVPNCAVAVASIGNGVKLLAAGLSIDPTSPTPAGKYRIDTKQNLVNNHSLPLKVVAKSRFLPTQTQMVMAVEQMISSVELTNPSALISLESEQNVTDIVSKPLAAWNEEKKRLLWKLTDLKSGPNKYLAQWSVSGRSTNATKPVAIRYQMGSTTGGEWPMLKASMPEIKDHGSQHVCQNMIRNITVLQFLEQT
jgi:hypothetical protein